MLLIVAVIVGFVPTSPAGVSIAYMPMKHGPNEPVMTPPRNVIVFPAPSFSVALDDSVLLALLHDTDRKAMSFVPDDTLLVYWQDGLVPVPTVLFDWRRDQAMSAGLRRYRPGGRGRLAAHVRRPTP